MASGEKAAAVVRPLARLWQSRLSGDRSRMTGDCHVRLRVQERWTHTAGIKPCRGRNQKPRSLDSKVEGDRDFEAYRQRHRKDGCESPGRSASERVCGLESEYIRGPSPQP